ncbi:hypothetical protein [Rubellicoccus peritrichatus]|uniref:Uncharacterized protein n=1 Tax=Rubellicoccus peritrichatus TaxID=3080537 RepID=A0AAQ3LEW0_9BACT|nr:hypothetical protein [Puniceicoccus sp. CR14]WOO43299.1 hypothetical protein RZN69_09370 [Puniceicoccus sp. CR14]
MSNPRGFALVIAIALMAFILLVVVSMSVLVTLETGVATQKKAEIEARQNALFGVQVALGELQRTAGPDSRVMARAEIFDADPATDVMEGVANPHWLAVFKTVEPGSETQSLENLRAWSLDQGQAGRVDWLVSSRNSLNDGILNPVSTNAVSLNDGDNDLVVSLAQYENASGGTDIVEAGKVDVQRDGSIVGRYSWWVADENAKFRLNVSKPDEVLGQPFVPERGLMAPHRANGTILSELSNFDVESSSQQFALGQAELIGDLSLVDEAWEDWGRDHGDDVSLVSSSIPVDVTQGKLKEDLSVYLGGSNSGLSDDDFIVRDNDDSDYNGRLSESVFDFDYADAEIPRFGLLKNWYQTGTAISGLAGGSAGSPRSHEVSQYGLHPVIMRTALYFTPSFWTDAAGKVHSAFLVYPKFVLWNPHNVPLAPAKYAIQVRAFTSLNTQINVGGENFVAYNNTKGFGYKNVNNSGLGHFNMANPPHPQALARDPIDDYPYFTFVIDNDGFAPGETLLYTASLKHPNSEYVNHDITDLENSVVNLANYNELENENTAELGFFTLKLTNTNSEFVPVPNAANPSPVTSTSDIIETTLFFRDVTVASPDGQAEPSLSTKLYLLTDSVAELIQFIDLRGDTLANTVIDWEKNDEEGWSAMPSNNPFNRAGEFASIESLMNDPFLATHHRGHGYFLAPMGSTHGGNRPRLFNRFNPLALNYSQIDPLFTTSGQTGQGRAYSDAIPTENWFNGSPFPTEIPADSHYAGTTLDGYDTPGGFGLTENNTFLDASTVYPIYDFPRGETDLLSLGYLTNVSFGQYHWQPAFPFGNSEVPTHVGRASVNQTHGNTNYYDLSYLLNESLWDRFYLSTIPQDTSVALSTETILPNTRNRLVADEDGVLPPDNELRDSVTAFQQSAANVIIEGGFNVNSTSVEAWKLLLASTLGESVTAANSVDSNALNEAPISARAYPILPESGGDISVPEVWSALRSLDQNEIDILANAIVAEVKRRGPFLSLADFVNRRLVANSDGNVDQDWLGLKGTLQAAIDRVTLEEGIINDAFHSDNAALSTAQAPPNPLYPEHETGVPTGLNGSRMFGVPGYLTQGDVLSVLAPLLTVRGDTFLVRAYGESLSPLNGEPLAKAWCEAVVKRRAEPVVAGDSIVQPTGEFGRQFEIVSIRWVNEEDFNL